MALASMSRYAVRLTKPCLYCAQNCTIAADGVSFQAQPASTDVSMRFDGASLQAQTVSTDVIMQVVMMLSSLCAYTVAFVATAVYHCCTFLYCMMYRHLLSCKASKACGHCVQAQMLSLTST
jgi:hypothetical protein